MDQVQLWCRVTIIGPDGNMLLRSVLTGRGNPDLEAVDTVVRFALFAKRVESHIVLSQLTPAMRDLVALSGLGIEMEREAEEGKDVLEVQEAQEEAHPGDLAAGDLEHL